jgi:hypothetical protein
MAELMLHGIAGARAAQALLNVADDPSAARAQARRGREYVCREWSRTRAFDELHRTLADVTGGPHADASRRAA